MTEHPVKWGDSAQYHAEPHANYVDEQHGVVPSAHLIWMTPDPLGVLAAFSGIYKGEVHKDVSRITDDMRKQCFEDVQKTHLQAPLELVKFHFLIEGVDRAFTHQHVRQRTAVYGQESLRFAIPGTLDMATTLPPSLQGTSRVSPEGPYDITEEQAWRNRWEAALHSIDANYHALVETGMPAEEARGLLPTAVATRIHYCTDMRNMKDHAGNRLCTQAQFHWRVVFAQMLDQIRNYTPDFYSWIPHGEGIDRSRLLGMWEDKFRWQYQMIADSPLWRPVCYELRYCPFQASFDRACSIRERVEAMGRSGIPSSEWHEDQYVAVRSSARQYRAEKVNGIQTAEWLLNPAAART